MPYWRRRRPAPLHATIDAQDRSFRLISPPMSRSCSPRRRDRVGEHRGSDHAVIAVEVHEHRWRSRTAAVRHPHCCPRKTIIERPCSVKAVLRAPCCYPADDATLNDGGGHLWCGGDGLADDLRLRGHVDGDGAATTAEVDASLARQVRAALDGDAVRADRQGRKREELCASEIVFAAELVTRRGHLRAGHMERRRDRAAVSLRRGIPKGSSWHTAVQRKIE